MTGIIELIVAESLTVTVAPDAPKATSVMNIARENTNAKVNRILKIEFSSF
jgi:hypothetical protein